MGSLYTTLVSSLTNPLIAGPAIGGLVMFLAYADSKLRDIPREKETYYKLFIVTSLIATVVVYLIVEEFTKTDEFLNQAYDTIVPKDIYKGRGGGGGGGGSSGVMAPVGMAVASAVVDSMKMKGPSMTVDLNALVPGDMVDPVQMKSERKKKR